MKLTPADDLKDELWGPIGTPERDAMEAQLKEEIHHYFAGEDSMAGSLKDARNKELKSYVKI